MCERVCVRLHVTVHSGWGWGWVGVHPVGPAAKAWPAFLWEGRNLQSQLSPGFPSFLGPSSPALFLAQGSQICPQGVCLTGQETQ